MASLEDVAAMKVHAVHNIGTRKKDFLDIYHLLERMPLNRMLDAYQTKYPDMSREPAIRGLGHHEEARLDYSADAIGNTISWEEITRRINHAIQEPNKIFKFHERKRQQGEAHQRIRRRRGPRF